ncbi:Dolichyl-phosphate beta-glucosyltransferase [Aphelenchoides fujianensis]|nr:Dolichyl-phosphate beta-glucosyltransferase [Aphelenchoides fujianensis]
MPRDRFAPPVRSLAADRSPPPFGRGIVVAIRVDRAANRTEPTGQHARTMIAAEFLLLALVCLPALVVLLLYLMLYYNTSPRRTWEFMIRERRQHSADGAGVPFECLLERTDVRKIADVRPTPAQCSLSVVIPAMNETARLPVMLKDCLRYLEERRERSPDFSYEVIVVDDGSTDGTADLAVKCGHERGVRVLKLERNVGKGGAVRNGVLCARGSLILFADADGATRFADVDKLEAALKEAGGEGDSAVAIGSRAHLEKTSIAQRSIFRTFLMIGFHALRLGIPVAEVAVEWHEVEGSKITPLLTSVEMGRDILLIWFRYYCNFWRVDDLGM